LKNLKQSKNNESLKEIRYFGCVENKGKERSDVNNGEEIKGREKSSDGKVITAFSNNNKGGASSSTVSVNTVKNNNSCINFLPKSSNERYLIV
jgi:hypothetical protein